MTKNKKNLFIGGFIVLFILALFGGYELGSYLSAPPSIRNSLHKKHLSQKLESQHAVTTAIQGKNNSNILIYNKNTNLKLLQSSIKDGQYDKLIIAMYSDGCAVCNKHKDQLADKLSELANDKTVVLAVDNGADKPQLNDYFELPDNYYYPTLFTFDGQTKVKNGPFILQSSETLYREKN